MTTATAPSVLDALDFHPVLPCGVSDEHAGEIPPAQWRSVKTCGCVSLLCGPHAEYNRQEHNALLDGERDYGVCMQCGAEPVLLAALEPINY